MLLLPFMCVHENVGMGTCLCAGCCIIEIFSCMTEGMGLMHCCISNNATSFHCDSDTNQAVMSEILRQHLLY